MSLLKHSTFLIAPLFLMGVFAAAGCATNAYGTADPAHVAPDPRGSTDLQNDNSKGVPDIAAGGTGTAGTGGSSAGTH